MPQDTPATKQSLLNSIIGTPEVQLSLSTKTIVFFFGGLVLSLTAIFLIHALIKKT